MYLDAFWIDKFEVSNSQYEQCVSARACSEPHDLSSYKHNDYFGNETYASYPVIWLDWYQARDYCHWVGGELPTEAQWEKAARGTDGNKYPWGDYAPNYQLANYAQNKGDTVEVGSYPDGASPYGALDMAGNVWEWVRDWYGWYDPNETYNPTGPGSGDSRVLRGGSWLMGPKDIRTARRIGTYPTEWFYEYGFRCVSVP